MKFPFGKDQKAHPRFFKLSDDRSTLMVCGCEPDSMIACIPFSVVFRNGGHVSTRVCVCVCVCVGSQSIQVVVRGIPCVLVIVWGPYSCAHL